MGNENGKAQLHRVAGQGAGSALLRHYTLFPPGPRPATRRGRLADGVFEFFLLLSRCTAMVGGILCGSYAQTNAFNWFLLGLLAGWAVGFWIRRSLGMRSWDPTHGFYVRLLERGNGNRPKRLESLVEKLRGGVFIPVLCCRVTGAYAEMQRQWYSCNSQTERCRLFDDLERKVMVILYGEQMSAFRGETGPALQTGGGDWQVRNASVDSAVMHVPAVASDH